MNLRAYRFHFLISFLFLSACTGGFTLRLGHGDPVSNNFYVPSTPITGSYCTLINTTDSLIDTGNPTNITCLQPNGQWQIVGGFPDLTGTPSNVTAFYQNATLSQMKNGDIVLTYRKTFYPFKTPDEVVIPDQMLMYKYQKSTGWSLVSPVSLSATKTPYSVYSQFGGSFFELKNLAHFFWTDKDGGDISQQNGSSWNTIPVDTSINQPMRHPEVYPSADPNFVYLHYGAPSPKVWKYDGTNLTKIGNVPVALPNEETLYTSLTEWNGKLVLAYSTYDYMNTQSWYTSTDTTKVFQFDGTNWIQMGSAIQDTAGRDGTKSFLFSQAGNLYVMYADYSTEGIPTDPQQIIFRFRVKVWDGTSWLPFGAESDPIYLSQRFEFFKDGDGGPILVNIIQPAPGGESRQMILSWTNGVFSYLGQPLMTWPANTDSRQSRPGAIIKL